VMLVVLVLPFCSVWPLAFLPFFVHALLLFYTHTLTHSHKQTHTPLHVCELVQGAGPGLTTEQLLQRMEESQSLEERALLSNELYKRFEVLSDEVCRFLRLLDKG